MRDGAVRTAVKAVARWHWGANLGLHRLLRRARGERPYRLAGSCGLCARCCEEPGIAVGRLTWYLRSLRAVFLAWQRHVNGFELVRSERAGRVFVFRCTHFDTVTRRCHQRNSRRCVGRNHTRRPTRMAGASQHCAQRWHDPPRR